MRQKKKQILLEVFINCILCGGGKKASHARICSGNLPGDISHLTQAAENNDARAEQTTASPDCYSLPAHTGRGRRYVKNVLYYYLAAWCAAVIKLYKRGRQ